MKTFFNIALAVIVAWWIRHMGGSPPEMYLAAMIAFSYNDLRDRIENKERGKR